MKSQERGQEFDSMKGVGTISNKSYNFSQKLFSYMYPCSIKDHFQLERFTYVFTMC